MENRKRNSGQNRLYVMLAVAVLLLGAVAGVIALSVSGCRNQDVPPSEDPSPAPTESSVQAESSEEPSSVSLPEPDVSGSSSQPSVISLPEESRSDLPVIVEGQPESAARYEESVGIRYQIDMNPYESYVCPEDPMEYVFLVNPQHKLASDYVPEDMIDCVYTRKDRATQKMRLYAEKALEAFLAEGALNGVTDVTVTSAYRSYTYQNTLFNRYVEQNLSKFETREEAEAYVLTFSTRPGTSEHQSGLCCDMHNMGSAQQSFAKKPEAKWLAENCWRFGFILRYPEDKEDITKIIYEPWHFRFVGRVAATEMHESGMCLEEYCDALGIG
ncbi:MAG: M15 family metallopeptidase [Clostridia bacterium]|nr:M15 family metallopeptidase [Clostridia bacterium]